MGDLRKSSFSSPLDLFPRASPNLHVNSASPWIRRDIREGAFRTETATAHKDYVQPSWYLLYAAGFLILRRGGGLYVRAKADHGVKRDRRE